MAKATTESLTLVVGSLFFFSTSGFGEVSGKVSGRRCDKVSGRVSGKVSGKVSGSKFDYYKYLYGKQ